ncbi:MAG: 4'-phosphopantetheinyl transferase superfamily protein [Spirochaetales bacterium]|nr:4'-phosphopantetheinyl transferase superfamily protein [Spirochaetales bacterium]
MSSVSICGEGVTGVFSAGGPLLLLADRDRLSPHLPQAVMEEILTADEISYLAQPLHRNTRSRYTIGRALLRLVITYFTEMRVPDRLFKNGMSGPPLDIAHRDGVTVSFSVSHSGNHTLIALCNGEPLGVDIETRRPLKEPLQTAAYAFSTEESEWLKTLDPDIVDTGFFRLWTRKEAVVKRYRGTVAHDMHRFTVPLEISAGVFTIYPQLAGNSGPLGLIDYTFDDRVFGALCCRKAEDRVAVYSIGTDFVNDCLHRFRHLV